MTDTAPQTIHQAIHAVKAALAGTGIAKGRTNSEQKFRFRGVEDVINALSELFVTHRINVVPRMVHTESIARVTGSGKPMPASFVQAEFDLVSVDDGSFVTFAACGEGADMADKGTNKAMSAAFKYAMTLGFVIPTEGVLDEGDATTPGLERDQPQQDRQQQSRQEQPRTQTMAEWVDDHIARFVAFTTPAQYEVFFGLSDDPDYKDSKARVLKRDKAAWDRLHAAENAAGQRTSDAPF